MEPPSQPFVASPEQAAAKPRGERRREPRVRSNGEVRLLVNSPLPLVISARLLDVSRSGFRAVHRCSFLESGQEVGYRHAAGQGRARIMWRRITLGAIECGFLIL